MQIEKCSVAQFIIQETKNFSHKLNYQSNGRATKLGKHVLECLICRGENVTIESRRNILKNSQLIEIENLVFDKLNKWKLKTGHHLSTDSQAIQLLMDYFEFAQKELKGKM